LENGLPENNKYSTQYACCKAAKIAQTTLVTLNHLFWAA